MGGQRLSADAFARAQRFLDEHARPLERALFAFRFDGGPADAVLAQLEPFANSDGGFGRALEPDVRTPSSSALATALALRTLEEIDCPTDHPLAADAVDWLVEEFNAAAGVWRVVPEDVNDHPHAPWWHDDGQGGLVRIFGGFEIIPRALLVGLLQRFRARLPEEWLKALTETTIQRIESLKVLGGGGGSDLEYARHLAETEALPHAQRERLQERVDRAVTEAVVRDPNQWSTYCVTPLAAAPTPDAPGAERIADELQAHLDYEIERQTDAGAWEPLWTFPYPESWAHARREWCGILTLDMLTKLRAFDRI